jgi:hypothetical protein
VLVAAVGVAAATPPLASVAQLGVVAPLDTDR